MTTEVYAFNDGSGHTLLDEGLAPAAPADAEAIRRFIAARYRAAGKSLPAVLTDRPATNRGGAAPKRRSPDPDAFDGRAVTGLFLSPDGQLVKQVRIGEDEPRMFAAPTPWSTQQDDRDGRARGDAGIVQRRTERDLRRQIDMARKRWRGAAFADKEAAKAKLDSLERELEELLQSQREERTRRNRGRDGLGGTSPMGE